MTYGDKHRYLLRTLMGTGILPIEEAEELMRNYTDESDDINIGTLVKEINNEIQQFQQDIKLTRDEATECTVLILLSLGYDDTTKSQNIFTASEMNYFRKILESIVTSDRRQITIVNALNLVTSVRGTITKSDAEKLLLAWCRMKYLERCDINCYGLSTRCIQEFEGYIRQHLPNAVEDCVLCKKIVFQGCNCPYCRAPVHTMCLSKFIEKINKWPCCKVEFQGLPTANINNSGDERLLELTETQMIQPEECTQSTSQMTQDHSLCIVDETSIEPAVISQSLAMKRKRTRND